MADIEEYFPRGGKKPAIKEFKQSSNFLGTVEKGEKKKKRIKKKAEGDDGYLSDEVDTEFEQSTKNCAVGLSYQTVKEGLVILGRVEQVLETKIYMSLPCRMKGTVMACHVSEPYTKLLEAYVADEVESVRELRRMFRPGQYVAVKVLEVEKQKDNLLLSMMPQHVNGGKTHADLQKGALIQAAVTSVEDHGYVMDLGIENARAFLPKKNSNEEIELDTGMVSWCAVKSVTPSPDNSIVTLTSQLAALQQPMKRKPSKGLSALAPGAALEFTVDKALENGIEGHVFDGITGYVQRQHASKAAGKKPALGQRIRAHLLYEMPTRKQPFLTLRSVFETSYPDLAEEQKLKMGDFVEDAQVIKITRRSVVMKLGAAGVGTLSLKRVQLSEDLSDEQVIAKSYPIGSTHRVRVLCYNLSDYAYSVSDAAEALSTAYWTLAQLTPGLIVGADVRAVRDSSLVLRVDRLTGIVPHSHLTDAGVYIDSKKPNAKKPHKKKYKEGQRVTARVLHVEPDADALFLTLKPSLLAPDLVVLKSYEDAVPGNAYTGVIKYTAADYILVTFFSNVTAYVPRGHVTKEPVDNLIDAFHPGQIVNCTIMKVDPPVKKMIGSLTVGPFTPKEKPQKRIQEYESQVPKKKSKHVENEIDSVEKVTKKKDKNAKVEEIENTNLHKTKKSRKQSETDQSEADEAPDADVEDKKTRKKKNEKKLSETENSAAEISEEADTKTRKRKKDRKQSETDEEEQKTSESDAIDTDLPDEDEILTPQDMILIDLTDCKTRKNYRKRVVSLLKAIQARTDRIVNIEHKIKTIEDKGLTPKNKKYHTAMHAEKHIVQERIKKLFEALQTAQEKLKEFPEEEVKDWKKKKNKKKEQKTEDGDVTDKKTKVAPKEKVKKSKVKKNKEDSVKDDIVKVADVTTSVLEVPSVKDFWSENLEVEQTSKDQESSSSDEEELEQPKKKRKKLTAAEKVAKAREEEERLRELERVAIEGAARPRSVEQFERALLASPDSSQLWIAYMAFHLQATDIEKARAVGRKALSAISFREEGEKLNVWLAMINFENRFGTKESQQKTLEDALQMNDTYKIHSKLLDIYAETSKVQELTSLVDLMMRKYKRDPQTYIVCGQICYKMALIDKARQVMQKAVSVLDKKEHVTVLVQFALMERAAGERERAEALFEQVLGVYPQRVDVCSTYVDMLLKSSDLDKARQVMERMTSQKLPARKMKILYKKWIEVEEKAGDKDQVERIRQKAMEFIEKAKF